jgi:hypothetical protein
VLNSNVPFPLTDADLAAFNDGQSHFIFQLDANPPNDPSLFIDIPLELYQPVAISFGEYDPSRFGEAGDIWMSSSELYEIERKASTAPKSVPIKVERAKHVSQPK